MAESDFNSKSLGLRVQKKLLSKMSKSMAKAFVLDDTTSELLDHVYKLAKLELDSKKDAEKLIKNIIKVVVKIGILYRNDQFNPEEIKTAQKFQQKFGVVTMTIVSYYEIDFSFDRDYLGKLIKDCEDLSTQLVSRHLTDKSVKRIAHVFGFFNNGDFMEKVFQKHNAIYRSHLEHIVNCLNKLKEQESI